MSSNRVVARATATSVCEALLEALARHGVPEQILTDDGKVFTGRFGPSGICHAVPASMRTSAAVRACSSGEVSLSEVASARAPSNSTAS